MNPASSAPFDRQVKGPVMKEEAGRSRAPGAATGAIGEQSPKIDIGNYKSALNEQVMKCIQRPLGGEDIVYTSSLVTMSGGMPLYKSTVRINAMDGREFEGKPQ